jgi:hypothetical protein
MTSTFACVHRPWTLFLTTLPTTALGLTHLQQPIKKGRSPWHSHGRSSQEGPVVSIAVDESSFIMVNFQMLIFWLPCFDSIQTLMLLAQLAQSHNFPGGHLLACIGGTIYGFPVTVHVQIVKVYLYV